LSPSKRILTPTRVVVGLLIVVNVGFAVLLAQSFRRTAALEKRVQDGAGRERGVLAPAVPRSARRAGQEELGERRPVEAEEQAVAEPIGAPPAEAQRAPADEDRERTEGVRVTTVGRKGPPEDPEEAFDALLERAKPNEAQERAMREAFERLHPKAVAAYHAGDEQGAKAAWQEYCEDVGRTLDEATLGRLGCKSVMTNVVAPPPSSREQSGLPAAPPPLDPNMLRRRPEQPAPPPARP
jgi:hypothetical protein